MTILTRDERELFVGVDVGSVAASVVAIDAKGTVAHHG